MDGSDWITAILAFVGAMLGAGLSAWVTLRGQRQSGREEWHRRLIFAIEHLTSTDESKQRIGRELVTDLVTSDLGTPEEQALAEAILRTQLESAVQHLIVVSRGMTLEDLRVEEDTEGQHFPQDGDTP